MADLNKLLLNLKQRGFHASLFETCEEANSYLVGRLAGKTIGMGGCMTVQDMGLDTALTNAGANLIRHRTGGTHAQAAAAPVYISSVNGAAETGELINIDGTGNRVASTIFGHEALYIILGANKVEPDFEKALWRARNISAPLNAKRLNKNTPCAVNGDRCYDCSSPDRICRALAVLWGPPKGIGHVEVIVVNQNLGL